MTMETLYDEFPELANPLCLRKGHHGEYTCGHCATARAIANGMTFGRVGEGPMTTADAIRYNLAICLKQRQEEAEEGNRSTVDEIRRDGQRILKAGANVYVQLKRKKGTARSEGYVVECYDNDQIKIHINSIGTTMTVPADEFVVARKGMTERNR